MVGGRFTPGEVMFLLGVSLGAMFLTSNPLVMIGALVAAILVISYLHTERNTQEQQRREAERQAEDWERLEERLRLRSEQDLRMQRERENRKMLLDYGLMGLPDGGYRVATPVERAAAREAAREAENEAEGS